MIHTIHLPVNPVPASRPRVSRKSGRVYYAKTYSAYKTAASQAMPGALFAAGVLRRLVGPLLVAVTLRVLRPKSTKLEYPKPDVDNYAKAVLDACNGHLWTDDEQVVGLLVTKEWANSGEPGSALIEVKELDAHLALNMTTLLPT